MTAFTLRLPDDVNEKLDALASKLDRSRFYVATQAISETQAISDFIARQSWQPGESLQVNEVF